MRTKKRASSPGAGLEPSARRQRTLVPQDAEAGASNPDDDVVYVGEPLSRSSPALSILSGLSDLEANILQQCSKHLRTLNTLRRAEIEQSLEGYIWKVTFIPCNISLTRLPLS